jgi:hypothetical protein
MTLLGYYAGHPRPHAHLTDEEPAKEGHRKGLLCELIDPSEQTSRIQVDLDLKPISP